MSHAIVSITIALAFGAVLLPCVIAYNYYFRIWWRAYQAGCPVPLIKLIKMTINRISPRIVVNVYVGAQRQGIQAPLDGLANHHKNGGNINRVVAMLHEAKLHGGDLTFNQACEFDINEHGLLEFPTGHPHNSDQ